MQIIYVYLLPILLYEVANTSAQINSNYSYTNFNIACTTCGNVIYPTGFT